MKTKILLIGIDGLILKTAVDSGAAPALAALKEEGFFAPLEVEAPTWSGPGWSTILTGSTHAQHGVRDNRFIGHNLLHRPDLLSRAFYQDQSTSTFAAAGWPPIVDPSGLGPIIHERREQQLAYRHRVLVRDGEMHGYKNVDAEIGHTALYAISNYGPDVSFVYFCGADEVGHVRGVIDNHYLEAIGRIDAMVAQLDAAVVKRAAELGEKWLVVLTTDHGHIDEGGHGGDSAQERASFLIAVGRGRSHPEWSTDQRPENIVELLLAERA
jgi:predicted AlkP superfamily pyrophosphatase or phosphodiesterase